MISFQEFRSYPVKNKFYTIIRNSKISTVVFLISYIDHTCGENVFCKSFRNRLLHKKWIMDNVFYFLENVLDFFSAIAR